MMELNIRGVNYELGHEMEEYIGHRLRFALGRFAGRVGRVTVRLSDVNGPRGGIDKRCRIVASLVPRGMVMVEGSGDDPFALIAGTAKRAGRAVRRELERRRRGRLLIA
jgi:ribosome-associated translation inhibitor RaiA